MPTQGTIIESHQVPASVEKNRLQEYAVGIFVRYPTRSSIKKAIKKGLVFINSERGFTGDWIQGGERLELYLEPRLIESNLEYELEVLYEDDYLAVIYKPPGILVSGNKQFTIENSLEFNLKRSTQPDAVRPEPIHRLDYPTTGALLIGKTAKTVTLLNELFEHRKIRKTYLAVTIGEMQDQGTAETPIDGKWALTEFKKLKTLPSKKYDALNLIELQPVTGRRHQLRIHLSEMGHSILGDKKYGVPGHSVRGQGLYLHAANLQFPHPVTQEMLRIEARLPKKFIKLFPGAEGYGVLDV